MTIDLEDAFVLESHLHLELSKQVARFHHAGNLLHALQRHILLFVNAIRKQRKREEPVVHNRIGSLTQLLLDDELLKRNHDIRYTLDK